MLEKKTHYSRLDQFQENKFKQGMICSQLQAYQLQVENMGNTPVNAEVKRTLNRVYNTIRQLKADNRDLEEKLRKLANKSLASNYNIRIPKLSKNDQWPHRAFKGIPIFYNQNGTPFSAVWELIASIGEKPGSELSERAFKDVLQIHLRGDPIRYRHVQ